MVNLPSEVLEKLTSSISGEIKTDATTRILFSTDASIHKILPLGVVFPRNIDELQSIVTIANQYKIPLIPRGSGSSLAGQSIGRGLIIDCSRYLNKLVEINVEEKTAVVEPGLILDELNRQVKKYDLQFGPDPASSERATLGGCIGNNAAGAHSLIHGMTADHVASTEVVLSDGSITTFRSTFMEDVEKLLSNEKINSNSKIEKNVYQAAVDIRTGYKDDIKNSWPVLWRRVSGYNLNYLLPWSPTSPPQWDFRQFPYPPVHPNSINLAQLLVGSEGTLGILRKATLRLVPTKKHTVLSVINFSSIYNACMSVSPILDLQPSAIELIPQSLINLARSVPSYANQLSFVVGDPAAMLVVEFSGDEQKEILSKIDKLKKRMEWEIEPLVATTPLHQKQVWDVRKVGLGILMSRLGDIKPTTFIEDMSVPVERLGEFIAELDKILKENQTFADYYGHASVGCLHVRPLLNIKTPLGKIQLRSIAEAAVELVLRMGGAVAGEHGDGITRGEWIERAYGPRIMQALHILKDAADPNRIFNPGKIVDTPRMDSDLRYGDEYSAQGWTPIMAFASTKPESDKLLEAIEQCNGVGVCRKSGGVMCPSFQATQDEFFSTRGRSNLLRAMVSHEFETQEIAIEAVKETLDNCLACKGCKAECPSAVDVAKLKYEFFQHYYTLKGHHHPLRDYIFGYISQIARLGHHFAIVANFILGTKYLATVREKTLGISKYRKLPQFAGDTIHKHAHLYFDAKREVDCLFLADPFNEYFFPNTGRDSLRVLQAAGCNVRLLSTLGAGRTLISKGFLKPAKKHAEVLIDEIKRVDPKGKLPIIGLEPSEIYTIKEEFQDLFPTDTVVKNLGKRSFMIDEYLLRPDDHGIARISKLKLKEMSDEDRTLVLLHGHCYQKAQPVAGDGYPIGVEASRVSLQTVGYQVKTIDDGCCGMAGAFGYEAEHYDLSMQIAGLSLFPSIKETAHSVVAASGISCQSQIEDGTGEKAYHPITLIHERCIGN